MVLGSWPCAHGSSLQPAGALCCCGACLQHQWGLCCVVCASLTAAPLHRAASLPCRRHCHCPWLLAAGFLQVGCQCRLWHHPRPFQPRVQSHWCLRRALHHQAWLRSGSRRRPCSCLEAVAASACLPRFALVEGSLALGSSLAWSCWHLLQ